MRHKGPLATLLAASAVAAVLVACGNRAGPADQPTSTASTRPAPPASQTVPPTPPPATPTTSATPRPVALNGTWAGRINGSGTVLAIAVTNGTAIAYLCDGRTIEAWLRGAAAGRLLGLTAVKGGGRLTGTLRGGRLRGTLTEVTRDRSFDLAAVHAPSGLYRATATVRGAAVVAGWIVLPPDSRRQVGLATVAGRQVRPSSLDLATRTATVAGGTVHAERQGGQR
jgi:serine/threonine-protein kinase